VSWVKRGNCRSSRPDLCVDYHGPSKASVTRRAQAHNAFWGDPAMTYDVGSMAQTSVVQASVAHPSEPTGRYQLIDEVMTSPLGPLWTARTLSGAEQGRLVTIRRLSTLGATPAAIDRLMADAVAALGVRDGRVVATLDVMLEADGISVVGEYVEGETLAALLQTAFIKSSPLPTSVATRIGRDVLAAVCAAKQQWGGGALSFPHGGLLPHSILVAGFGEAMVSDIGVARGAFDLHGALGNLDCARYRAPEQASRGHNDESTDVYTMGVVLWEMLANQPLPPNAPALDRVERAGPPIAEGLARLVERALDPNPDVRFATLREMMFAINEACTEIAAPEQVLLTLDRLARPAMEARRTRLGASLPSERPERSPPSNRPTLQPLSPWPEPDAAGASASPTEGEPEEFGFTVHEHPTLSDRERVGPLGAIVRTEASPPRRVQGLSVIANANQLAVAANDSTAGIERASSRPPRDRRVTIGVAALVALGIIGTALILGARGPADAASRLEPRSPSSAPPAATPPPSSKLPVGDVASAAGNPAAPVGPPSAAPNLSPSAPPALRKAGPTKRVPRDSAFRPHGP
jgi:eukaryotic-like serine/threonine-protein kinase